MNYLDLCQEVRRECAISGGDLPSTSNQEGLRGKLVSWVNRAYRDIQVFRDDWDFRRATKSFTVNAGIQTLTSEMTDAESVIFLSAYLNTSDEAVLYELPYRDFYSKYLIGTRTAGRPTVYTLDNKNLILNSPLDVNYNFNLTYVQEPLSLTNDSDEPLIPARFQDVIIWRACMYYSEHQEATAFYQTSRQHYLEYLGRMEQELRPQMEFKL